MSDKHSAGDIEPKGLRRFTRASPSTATLPNSYFPNDEGVESVQSYDGERSSDEAFEVLRGGGGNGIESGQTERCDWRR